MLGGGGRLGEGGWVRVLDQDARLIVDGAPLGGGGDCPSSPLCCCSYRYRYGTAEPGQAALLRTAYLAHTHL
jgi:hypothetical protein